MMHETKKNNHLKFLICRIIDSDEEYGILSISRQLGLSVKLTMDIIEELHHEHILEYVDNILKVVQPSVYDVSVVDDHELVILESSNNDYTEELISGKFRLYNE